MKCPYIFLLAVIFITGSCPHAQTSLKAGEKSLSIKNSIIYQYPQDGENNVQQATTLIIRPKQIFTRSRSASNFSFTVNGEQSGNHKGRVMIADDNETVIFIPEVPFALGERVFVIFTISGAEAPPLISYSFHITSMSAKMQEYWRNYFNNKFDSEKAEFRKQTALNRKEIQGIPLDTLPWYFPKLQIDLNSPGASSGNIFLTPMGSSITTQFAFITMTDNTGTPIFWREITGKGAGTADFKVLPNNNLLFPIAVRGNNGSYGEGEFFEMDSHYKIIDSFKMGNGLIPDVHDFELLPNGHALMQAYVPVQVGSLIVSDNIIQEIDQKNKQVVFTWSALAHFQVADTYEDTTTGQAIDFAHLNSFQTDTDHNIIASFRHLDEVTKIDRNTGDIIWHWGGKHNQFAFLGDTLKFSHQHHARRITNGHITMFDNGNNHSVYFQGNPIPAPSSRAIEYDLDETHHTATTIWQYKNIPFSKFAGSVQRLPNGNTLIGLGELSSPAVMEVTPTKDVVFQLSLPQQTVSYRAYRFDWVPSAVTLSPNPVNTFEFKSIYPNPAENFTTLTFTSTDAGTATAELVDVLGHSHHSSSIKISGSGSYIFNIDVRDLPVGMYYCKLSQNGRSVMKALVVQK